VFYKAVFHNKTHLIRKPVNRILIKSVSKISKLLNPIVLYEEQQLADIIEFFIDGQNLWSFQNNVCVCVMLQTASCGTLSTHVSMSVVLSLCLEVSESYFTGLMCSCKSIIIILVKHHTEKCNRPKIVFFW
jgi:hypothetical protein